MGGRGARTCVGVLVFGFCVCARVCENGVKSAGGRVCALTVDTVSREEVDALLHGCEPVAEPAPRAVRPRPWRVGERPLRCRAGRMSLCLPKGRTAGLYRGVARFESKI